MEPGRAPDAGGLPGPDDAQSARRRAFERWVEPEIQAVLRVAHALTQSWPEAEDVAQDTLIRAYRAVDGFDGRHPRAWLFTIVRRTHLNSLRRTRPVLVDDAGLDGAVPAFGPASSPSPEEIVTDAGWDADVEQALADLDLRFRRAVLLVDVQRLTYAEAAAALGVPVGTLMSRLSRGRSRLRAALAHRRPGSAAHRPRPREDR